MWIKLHIGPACTSYLTRYHVANSANTPLEHMSAIPNKATWTPEGRARQIVYISNVASCCARGAMLVAHTYLSLNIQDYPPFLSLTL